MSLLGMWGLAGERPGVRVKESRETWSRSTEKSGGRPRSLGAGGWGCSRRPLLGSLELGLGRQDGWQVVKMFWRQGRMQVRGSWKPGVMSFPRQECGTGTESQGGAQEVPLVAE